MLRIQIKYLLGIYSVQGSMTKLEELLQVCGTLSVSLNLQNSHKFVNQRLSEHGDPLLAKTKIDSVTYKWGFIGKIYWSVKMIWGRNFISVQWELQASCLSPLLQRSFLSRGRSLLPTCTLLVASTQPQFLRTTLPKSWSHPPEPAYIGTLYSCQP